jgi:hypothetical protein
MSAPLLNIEELAGRHEVSDHNRLALFNDILKSCHNKIKKYNKDFKKQECLYAPPAFIIGKPPYNYVDLVNHIMDSLRDNGLKTEWLPQKRAIYVSWKPIDINMEQYQSNFTDTVYAEGQEDSLQVMTVRPKVQAPIRGKKKVDKNPHLQHVAMINYGQNTSDLIPVNIKGFKTTHGGLRP